MDYSTPKWTHLKIHTIAEEKKSEKNIGRGERNQEKLQVG